MGCRQRREGRIMNDAVETVLRKTPLFASLTKDERRSGRRFVSEVLEIHRYDPDADEYDFGAIYQSRQEQP